jgi:ribosomal protein S27AE
MKLIIHRQIIVIMDKETCDRCGHDMEKITTCHLICPNCGANYDCSDKGSVW